MNDFVVVFCQLRPAADVYFLANSNFRLRRSASFIALSIDVRHGTYGAVRRRTGRALDGERTDVKWATRRDVGNCDSDFKYDAGSTTNHQSTTLLIAFVYSAVARSDLAAR